MSIQATLAVFRLRDILVLIRILGSEHLSRDPDPALFAPPPHIAGQVRELPRGDPLLSAETQGLSRCQQKAKSKFFFSKYLCLLVFVGIFTSVLKDKKSTQYGSGFRRPKILRIRIMKMPLRYCISG
jgi:hypothetical protein